MDRAVGSVEHGPRSETILARDLGLHTVERHPRRLRDSGGLGVRVFDAHRGALPVLVSEHGRGVSASMSSGERSIATINHTTSSISSPCAAPIFLAILRAVR